MKVKRICGVYELIQEYLADSSIIENPIISIYDPAGWSSESKSRPDFLNKSNVLQLDFHDVALASSYGEFVFPTREMVEKALKFGAENKNIIIHCYAGISRSTTLAYGILINSGFAPVPAAMQVRKLRKNAIFNTYILGILSDVLDVKFEHLCEAYRKVFFE